MIVNEIFIGTTSQLVAELKSLQIPHSVKQGGSDAYIYIHLYAKHQPQVSSASIGFYPDSRKEANERIDDLWANERAQNNRRRGNPSMRYEPRPNAQGTLEGVEQADGTLRLTVTLDDDPSLPLYKELYEQWERLRNHLESVGRLRKYEQTVTPIEQQPVAAKKPGPDINEADQWLIERFFDVHHEEKKLPYFRDEWLKRRAEQSMPELTNVADRMRQTISGERKRRGMKSMKR